jgi:hypothetical protein
VVTDLSGKRDTSGIVGLPEGVAGQLRRRELLQAGAGAAIALGLSSCGIGRGLQGDTDRVIEPKVDGDLYYFNYSQYINPGLVKEFEQKYDVRVIQSYFDAMEGMIAKLRAGNTYDVVFPTAEYVQRLVQEEQAAADSARQAREPRQHLQLLRRPVVRPRLGALGAVLALHHRDRLPRGPD